MFNDGLYYERALAKELRMVVQSDNAAPPAAHQRRGSRSQIVAYWEGTVKVCVVHQYWHRRSGTVGGSGLKRPDPVMIFKDGIIYKVDSEL